MRVSSTTIFEHGVGNMLARQHEVLTTQNRISTGRRVLTPADDPVAAAQMLDVGEAKQVNAQYAENAATVKARLAQQEVALVLQRGEGVWVEPTRPLAGPGAGARGGRGHVAPSVSGASAEGTVTARARAPARRAGSTR